MYVIINKNIYLVTKSHTPRRFLSVKIASKFANFDVNIYDLNHKNTELPALYFYSLRRVREASHLLISKSRREALACEGFEGVFNFGK